MSLSFIVPIKSKKVTSDWVQFNKLINRTLNSICSQTDESFKVFVVCHELPEIELQSDKIQFELVDFEPPKLGKDEKHNISLKETDKAKKVLLGIKCAIKYESDYIMVVDSDDCISSRIASFVNKNSDTRPNGWYLDSGYYYNEGKRYLIKKKASFYGNCGSCLILRSDLAHLWVIDEPFLYYDHQKIEKDNFKLLRLPFFGAIYSMANGENHYKSWENVKKIAKKYLLFDNGKFRPYAKLKRYSIKFLNNKTRRKYGLYRI